MYFASVSSMPFWKASSPNRPPLPLHPSTLYPLQCFLPVNLYPLLSWISLHTCVNKDSVSMCLCVGPCAVWRGDVSPTYVRILEDPNLLGINQNTCSKSTLCQWLTLCPNGFPGCRAFCFTTWVISVVWNQFNDCAWAWFVYANATCGEKGVGNIQRKKTRKRP